MPRLAVKTETIHVSVTPEFKEEVRRFAHAMSMSLHRDVGVSALCRAALRAVMATRVVDKTQLD